LSTTVEILLKDVDFIPLQFIKCAIKHRKALLLQKIVQHLPCFIDDRWLARENMSIVETSEYPQDDKLVLNLALQSNNEILNILLNETNLDVLKQMTNGDTCIHQACRSSIDLALLNTLLFRLRLLLPEREQL
jgi:hypothetical protein